MSSALCTRPLTPARWADLERLFGPRGACAGCWCMWWRLKRSEFERNSGDENRRALRDLVDAGARPGLLAYRGRRPVGWVAVEPREAYPVLARSRNLKPVDALPTWVITCFFVAKEERGTGLVATLVDAAVDHVRRGGGERVEAMPVDTGGEPDPWLFTGIPAHFERAGFVEIARRAPKRPVLRLEL